MKTLLVVLGPTGVGKTALAIEAAERLGCPIVNADSRQIYREIPIGTAAPTDAEQARVKHYFVGTRSVTEDYNAGMYEREATALLTELFKVHETVVMAGGGMMYIDAVCKGLDDIPETSEAIRQSVRDLYASEGIVGLQKELSASDPAYCATADMRNPQRLMHAIEVCRNTGVPYSTLRTGTRKERDFRIVKAGLYRERQELYARINGRVDEMMRAGLIEEAQRMWPLRHLNSLQTVGYRELFRYFEGECTLEEATDAIRQNSRHYAKRQLTWWRRQEDIRWADATQVTGKDLTEMI